MHPHMLPHGCGYALANADHDTRAQHTVGYTELALDRFKGFWKD